MPVNKSSLIILALLISSACSTVPQEFAGSATDSDETLSIAPPDKDSLVRKLDISGIYISEISSNHNWYFKSKLKNLVLRFQQNDNHFVATDSTYQLKIDGEILGNIIRYYVYPSLPTGGNAVSGKWVINNETGDLIGKWSATAHAAGGAWNNRKLSQQGVELYTTETGESQPFSIEQSDELFDLIFDAGDERNIVFYLHGRGQDFERNFDVSQIPLIEKYSNTRFVIVRWLSWGDQSSRPYQNAISSVAGISKFLHAYNSYKSRSPEIIRDKSVMLLAHSMGNIPLEAFLKHAYQAGDLQRGLLNSIVFSSADLPLKGHQEWIGKCDFADETFVIQHGGDMVLQISELFFRDDQELQGSKLGSGFGSGSDHIHKTHNSAAPNKSKYLDITNLTFASHKHFLEFEAFPLFTKLLNGRSLEFPDPGIGLFTMKGNNPVYYFHSSDPGLAVGQPGKK